ncbi:MAG: hypothetical protein ACLQBX_12855 [Candidatus Limnocylindrales bacterium]
MSSLEIGHGGPGVEMYGRLRADVIAYVPTDPFTTDGITVRVRPAADGGLHLTAAWPTCPAWSPAVHARIAAAVDSYLLAFSLRTGHPLSAEWSGASGPAVAGGGPSIRGWITFHGASRQREAVRPLQSFAPDARMIADHPEVLDAAGQCRGAFQLRWTTPAAAMGLAYLAVERLVTHVLRSGPAGSLSKWRDWERAAPQLAATREDVLRLYWSTQLGRHVDAADARKQLGVAGWKPLAAPECCDVAADIVLSYLTTLNPA